MKTLTAYLDDIFFALGAVLVTAGAFLILPVAALFVGGFFCLVFSYLIGKGRAKG